MLLLMLEIAATVASGYVFPPSNDATCKRNVLPLSGHALLFNWAPSGRWLGLGRVLSR